MKFKDLTKEELSRFEDYSAHEIVRRVEDKDTGLLAFIAVHNTNIGPGLGGCRVRPYKSEEAAITDVLRLSKGMTYKNALAGLPLGGGKAVIMADPFAEKTPAMMEAMAKAIHNLNGQYVSAEDSGLSEDDVRNMYKHTPYVTGFVDGLEGGVGGNPAPITAHGVYHGIKIAADKKYGTPDLRDKTVSIQGMGAVGMYLADLLDKDGTKLIVTDIRQASLDTAQERFRSVKVVAPEDIFNVDADIFAPCAMGAQLNENTIPQLRADIVAGAANNQLARRRDGQALFEKGILYAPDFAINSGGVISVGYEYFQRSGNNPYSYDLTFDSMISHVQRAVSCLDKIFDVSKRENIPPEIAANKAAEKIFETQDNTNAKDQYVVAS